jgi:hypothetical protein
MPTNQPTTPQCDIIIDESYEASTGGITTMDLFLETHGVRDYADQIPAISAARVYTIAGTTGVPVATPGSFNLGSVGLDWFERGTSRPDEVRTRGVWVGHPHQQS